MAKKSQNTPVSTEDVDDFLNDAPTVIEDEIDTSNLDLTQIPPPDNVIISNTHKDTAGAPPTKGTQKQVTFSRFGANKRPITTDLSDQMLPPITKKTTAIYQLLGIDAGGRSEDKRIIASDSAAARIVDTSDVEMHHTYSIYDRFEEDFGRRNKIVTYFDGVQRVEYKDPITGQIRPDIRQKIGTPRFVRGQHMCDIMKNYHQYLWWELHPGNKNNKFRDKSKAAMFERVDNKHHNPHVEQVRMEIKIDAMNYVRSLQADQCMDLAAALDIPTFRVQPNDIKTALYVMAESDPEKVMYKSHNKAISVTITVMRAIDFGIIDYDAMRKQYFFAQNPQPIFQVPLDESPTASLAKHLVNTEEGNALREKMEEFIMYWQ